MQRVKDKLRDRNPGANVVTHSRMATRGPTREVTKGPLIRQAPINREGLDRKTIQETIVAVHQKLAKTKEATMQTPAHLKVGEDMRPFLQACMKLLCHQKTKENLQVVIDSCVGQSHLSPEVQDVPKLGRYRKCTGREMRLTAQIGNYEMD